VLNVDTTSTSNLIMNSDFEPQNTLSPSPLLGWLPKNGSTISSSSTTVQVGAGYSLQVVTSTTANSGVLNFQNTKMLLPNTQYTFSFWAKVASGSITDIVMGRQESSGTDSNCGSSRTFTTSPTRFSCTFTTGASLSSPNIYIQKTGTVAETFYIDQVQLELGSAATTYSAQWNGGAVTAGGKLTLGGGMASDIVTADGSSTNSNSLTVATGYGVSFNNSGNLNLSTGYGFGSGSVNISSGYGTYSSGAVNISTGNSVSYTSAITLQPGTTTSGLNAGAINLYGAGSSGGTGGAVNIAGGCSGTVDGTLYTCTTGGAVNIYTTSNYGYNYGNILIGSSSMSGTSSVGAITLGQSTNTNTINIGSAALTGTNVQTINLGYNVSSNASSSTNLYLGNSVGSGSTNIYGGAGLINLNSATLIKPTTASTTALQIQNASSLNVLSADTVNNRLAVNATFSSMSVPSISGTATATTGGVLAQNTTYYYVMTAVDGLGNETTKSNQVTQLTGNTTATNTITLTWAPISGAASYRIYRTTTSGDYSLAGYYSTTGTLSGSNLTFTDTTKNGSNGGIGAPPSINKALVAVANTNTNTTLQVAIGNNGTPVGQLYVSGIVPSGAIGGIPTTSIQIPAPVLSSTATATTGGTLAAGTYYYVITAVYGSNETTQSNQLSRVTTGATSTVTLTWPSIYSASSYRIYRSTSSGVYTSVGYYSTTGTVSGANLTFTDTNAAKTVTSVTPPVVNTTSVSLRISDITVQGNYAYVTEYGSPNSRLEIFDITNPTNPVSVSTLSINAYANNIVVSGRYAYIGSGMFGSGAAGTIQTINISNPSVPVSVSSLSVGAYSIGATALGAFSHDMTLIGNILYVNLTSTGNAGSHQAYNVANPAALSALMASPLSSANGGSTHALVANGRFLYSIGGSTSYLETVDTSVPTAMTLAGTLSGYGNVTASASQGRYLYVTNSGNFYTFDISNPTAPVLISTLAHAYLGDNSITVSGQYAYVTNTGAGSFNSSVIIINISNPQTPIIVGTVSAGIVPNFTGSTLAGRYLYAIDSGTVSYMRIIDLGGTYSQNIQSGNEQTSNLQVDNTAQINGSLTVVSGLNVSGTTNLQGSVDIGTSTSYANKINLGNTGAATLTLRGGATSYTLTSGVQTIQSTNDNANAFMLTNASSQNQILLNTVSTNLNLLGNSDFEYNPGTGSWLAKNAATITNSNTYSYEGNYSAIITTNTTANAGMSFAYTLSPSTTYTLSVYARASSSVASDFIMGRQDVSGTDVSCAGQTLSTTTWTRYTCTFTTGATITSSNIYFQRAGLTNYSIYLDAVQLQTGSTATAWTPSTGSIQIAAPITNPLMIRNTINSPYEFQVMNAAGSQLLGVDSQNVNTTVNTTLTLNTNLNLPTPTAPTITPTGVNNSITYTYAIVAVASNGQLSLASPTGTTAAGNSSLVTASNTIAWTAVSGASSYRVYRTVSGGTPSSTGLIGTTTSNSLSDTGLAGDGSTYNSTANTAGLSVIDSVNTNYLSLGSANTLGIGLGSSTINTTVYGNFSIGGLAGTGGILNNGKTTNTTLSMGNLTSGAWGTTPYTAAQTVDIYSSFSITPTTSGRTYTIPTPTSPVNGQLIYVSNTATYGSGFSFSFLNNALVNATINPGATATIIYSTANGWQFAGADGSAIINQNSAAQSGSNFWISGSGTASSFLVSGAGGLDTNTAGTLNIGTSTATTVNIGYNSSPGTTLTTLRLGTAVSGGGYGGQATLTLTGGGTYASAILSTSFNSVDLSSGGISLNAQNGISINTTSGVTLTGGATRDISTPSVVNSASTNTTTALTVQPGSVSGSCTATCGANGAALNLYGGSTSTGLGAGGDVNIKGGSGFSSGSVNITTTSSYASSGGININPGSTVGPAAGSSVYITGGAQTITSGYYGGNVYLRGAAGTTGNGSVFISDNGVGWTYIGQNGGAQRVGIDNTSPSYVLDIGNSNVSGIVSRFVNSTGSCTINPTTTSLSCSSDETLKKDITGYNITAALNSILGLTAVTYHWNSEDSSLDATHTGFIAQEVQKILPDLVATDATTGLLSLSYAGLTPYLVSAIQAQQQQINQTSSDVTTLQSSANIVNGGAVNGDLSITGSMNVAGNLNASGPVAISSTLTVTGDATFSGTLTVQNISVHNITINGHIITAGDTPTATVDTAAGSADPLNSIAAPTVTIDGNDTAGTITITTGANTSSGTLANITFNTPYGKAPRVILNADNSAMTNLKYFKASTSTAFTIQAVDSPTPNTTYQLDYFIAQ